MVLEYKLNSLVLRYLGGVGVGGRVRRFLIFLSVFV